MNRCLMQIDAKDFDILMRGYAKLGIKFCNCLDGGAGAGMTAKKMLPYIQENGLIFAFEPFPGNFRFLDSLDNCKIKVIKKALYFENIKKELLVNTTVTADSDWGKKGFEGYSSGGFIVNAPNMEERYRKTRLIQEKLHPIDCVAADAEISASHKIDFVKLDLQGGEFNALMGMRRIIFEPYFLWIEFSDQPELLNYLYDLGFIVFETDYVFTGSPPEPLPKDFAYIREATSSGGTSVWYGRRITPWGRDFHDEFLTCKTKYSLIQTDIVCVHHSRYQLFNKALAAI